MSKSNSIDINLSINTHFIFIYTHINFKLMSY